MIEKCRACGGDVEFSPEDNANRCKSCNKIDTILSIKSFPKHSVDTATTKDVNTIDTNIHSLKCNNCGANLVLGKYEMKTVCPYCGNTEFLDNIDGQIDEIDSIVPFKISKSRAVDLVKEKIDKHLFLSSRGIRAIDYTSINGIYVNAYIFDMPTKSVYSGIISKDNSYTNSDGTIVQNIEYENIVGTYDKEYNDITIEANSHISQLDLASILPYNYDEAVEFKSEYLAGYSVEYKDKQLNTAQDMAKVIVDNMIKQEIRSKYCEFNIEKLDVATQYNNNMYNYSLLPMYIINNSTKNKTHFIYVNGQTGKVGNLPLSGWKIFIFILAILLGIIGIGALIFFLM